MHLDHCCHCGWLHEPWFMVGTHACRTQHATRTTRTHAGRKLIAGKQAPSSEGERKLLHCPRKSRTWRGATHVLPHANPRGLDSGSGAAAGKGSLQGPLLSPPGATLPRVSHSWMVETRRGPPSDPLAHARVAVPYAANHTHDPLNTATPIPPSLPLILGAFSWVPCSCAAASTSTHERARPPWRRS